MMACFRKKSVWNRIIVAAAGPQKHTQTLENSSSDDDAGHDVVQKIRNINTQCEIIECFCQKQAEPFHVSRCLGKEWHLTRVLEEHRIRTGEILERHQVLFLDDCSQNIRQAKKDGYRVFEVSSKKLDGIAGAMDDCTWRKMIEDISSNNI